MTSAPTIYPDNGILAGVPGQFVARGSATLPDPESSTAEEMGAEVDSEWAGRVCITYRRVRFKHRKLTRWYWQAVRADAASPLA
jgi:hypothetical protein